MMHMPPILFDGLLLRAYDDADLPVVLAAILESVETVGRWMPWCHTAFAEANVRSVLALLPHVFNTLGMQRVE